VSKDKAMGFVRRALQLATDHLSGNRDESVPEEFDSQIGRFAKILREMLASLEEPGSDYVSIGYRTMFRSILDSWPHNTELGVAIRDAEEAYFSSLKGTT
jgi:hypothetical protein